MARVFLTRHREYRPHIDGFAMAVGPVGAANVLNTLREDAELPETFARTA